MADNSTTTGNTANTGPGATAPTPSGKSAGKRYMLKLRPPKPDPNAALPQGAVAFANITHRAFLVSGQLVDVPIGGELEVSEEVYKAVTAMELPEGFSWGK